MIYRKLINILTLLLLLFSNYTLYSQEIYIKNDNLYGKITNGMPEKDSLIITKKNGIIVSEGKYALSKKELSNLKVGYWKEYDDEEKLTQEGNYKIGSYLQCCAEGPCKQYYFYREGVWKFYENETEYQLNFEPKELYIDTLCKKNDLIIFGIVNDYSYNKFGIINPEFIFESQKVEIETKKYLEIYTPLNNRLYIKKINK